MPIYYGTIVQSGTETPLPGASVTLKKGDTILTGAAADASGKFRFTTTEPATQIIVSYIDHRTTIWDASEMQHLFPLETDPDNEGEVIIYSTPKKKSKLPLILFGGFLLLMATRKKKKRNASYNRR